MSTWEELQKQERQQYMQYSNDITAIGRRAFGAAYDKDPLSPEVKAMVEAPSFRRQTNEGKIGIIADLCIDHAIPWEQVGDRSIQAGVKVKTADEVHAKVQDIAEQRAMEAGYDGLTKGMDMYLRNHDAVVDKLYDQMDMDR